MISEDEDVPVRPSRAGDLENLKLLAQADCPDCHGERTVQSEDWTAFEEWRQRRPSVSPEAEDDLVERYFLEVCDYSSVPAMAEDCERCDGTGKTSVEFSVADLLALVFERVSRPVISPGELDEVTDHVKRAMTAAALQSSGLVDSLETGVHLRAVQEGAEALRSLGELRARRRD